MASGWDARLRQLLCCPGCCGVMGEPHSLPCGHRLCASCLSSSRCPRCNAPFPQNAPRIARLDGFVARLCGFMREVDQATDHGLQRSPPPRSPVHQKNERDRMLAQLSLIERRLRAHGLLRHQQENGPLAGLLRLPEQSDTNDLLLPPSLHSEGELPSRLKQAAPTAPSTRKRILAMADSPAPAKPGSWASAPAAAVVVPRAGDGPHRKGGLAPSASLTSQEKGALTSQPCSPASIQAHIATHLPSAPPLSTPGQPLQSDSISAGGQIDYAAHTAGVEQVENVRPTGGVNPTDVVDPTTDVSHSNGVNVTNDGRHVDGTNLKDGVSATDSVNFTSGISPRAGVSLTDGVSSTDGVSTTDSFVLPRGNVLAHPSCAGESLPTQSHATGPARGPVTMLMTGMESDELQLLKAIAKRLGASVAAKWTASVSHVVTPSRCGSNAGRTTGILLASRTVKYCSAVLQGQWIVESSWVLDSDSAGRWVDEQQYEIAGDHKSSGADGKGLGAPRMGRLRCERQEPPLLAGWNVCLNGNFTAPKKGALRDLFIAGGATLFEKIESLPRAAANTNKRRKGPVCAQGTTPSVVVLSEDAPSSKILDACGRKGIPLVSTDWLLDSISHFKIQPFSLYSW